MLHNPRIFIGYDTNETIAYHVLVQSIIENSSLPLSITPIALNNVQGIFHREQHPLQSTQFSFSRFLTPYLANYEGWSIFMDCDMIVRTDIAKLWALRDDSYSIMCCKHDYTPVSDTKFLGNVQSKYEKKNWSSVMMFNNAKCKALTPEYVNTRSGLELHQFKWLGDSGQIGSIPLIWNHLVGEYEHDPKAALVHYTYGGPYFEEYLDCDYAEDWQHYKRNTLHATQRSKADPQPV